jgi:hypothetical protein
VRGLVALQVSVGIKPFIPPKYEHEDPDQERLPVSSSPPALLHLLPTHPFPQPNLHLPPSLPALAPPPTP